MTEALETRLTHLESEIARLLSERARDQRDAAGPRPGTGYGTPADQAHQLGKIEAGQSQIRSDHFYLRADVGHVELAVQDVKKELAEIKVMLRQLLERQ